jgi:hypothetical protein
MGLVNAAIAESVGEVAAIEPELSCAIENKT